MKVAGPIIVYGEATKGTVAAITLDELSLKNLNSAKKGLIVFWDVVNLIIEKFNCLLCLRKFHFKTKLVLYVVVQLLLHAHYLLL